MGFLSVEGLGSWSQCGGSRNAGYPSGNAQTAHRHLFPQPPMSGPPSGETVIHATGVVPLVLEMFCNENLFLLFREFGHNLLDRTFLVGQW